MQNKVFTTFSKAFHHAVLCIKKLTLTRCSWHSFRCRFPHGDCHMSACFWLSIAFMWHTVDRTHTASIAQLIEETVDRWPLNLFEYVVWQAGTVCFSIHRCGGVWLIDIYGGENNVRKCRNSSKNCTHISSRCLHRSERCSSHAVTSPTHSNYHLLPIHCRCCTSPSAAVSMFEAMNWKLVTLTFAELCCTFHLTSCFHRPEEFQKCFHYSTVAKTRGRFKKQQNIARNVNTQTPRVALHGASIKNISGRAFWMEILWRGNFNFFPENE